MTYYFSATGNSKYVAERIAGALDDEARSIQGCDGRLSRSDVIGFVTPTYAWGPSRDSEAVLLGACGGAARVCLLRRHLWHHPRFHGRAGEEAAGRTGPLPGRALQREDAGQLDAHLRPLRPGQGRRDQPQGRQGGLRGHRADRAARARQLHEARHALLHVASCPSRVREDAQDVPLHAGRHLHWLRALCEEVPRQGLEMGGGRPV